MSRLNFRVDLSKVDRDLIRTIRTLLHVENRDTFTSDDFRNWQLDKSLGGHESNRIGAFFSRAVINNAFIEVGTTPSQIDSNHWRKIRVYELAPQQKLETAT